MKVIKLSKKEAKPLAAVFSKIKYPTAKKRTDEILEAYVYECMNAVVRFAPGRLVKAALAAKSVRSYVGGLLIRGLPVDDRLPQTPLSGLRQDMDVETPISDGLIVGIAALMGEVLGFVDEKGGELVHDLIPVKYTNKPYSNEGQGVFPWHIENAIFDQRESFLLLEGIRAATKGGATSVASGIAAVKLLDDSDVELLFDARFKIRRPYVYDGVQNVSLYSDPQPILQGSREDPIVRVALCPGGTLGMDSEAEIALTRFAAALDKVAEHIVLEPGMLVIVDNSRLVHRRAQFSAKFDGQDRHLKRVFVYPNLQQLRHCQGEFSRILTGRF